MSQLATPGRTARPSRTGIARAPRLAPRTSARVRPTTSSGAHRVEAVGAGRQSGPGFAILIGAIALFGIMALLMLNTMRAEQSFTVGRLQGDVTTLQQRQQQLESDLSAVSAPESLAMKADALGMVKAPSVKYVDATSHKSLGVAVTGGAGQPLNVVTLPDTPASKVATQMLASGSIGSHISDPVKAAQQQADAAAKAAAAAAEQKAQAAKKAAASSTPKASAGTKDAQKTTSKH